MAGTEGNLVQAAQSGSPGAFEQLALPLADSLYSVIAGMVGRSDAEDLLQDTLLSAFRAISNFRGDCSFATWISRIATNAARTHLRKKRPVSANPGNPDNDDAPADPLDAVASSNPGPVEELTIKEDKEWLGKALGRLPADERETLVMREVDGLSYDAIANALEVSEATVRSRLHRARNKMLGLLGGVGGRNK